MTRRASTTVTTTRWAAYAAAGTAATLSGQTAEASITVADINMQLLDSNQGDGYFDTFSFDFGGDALIFQFAFNETGTSVGQMVMYGSGVDMVGFAAGPYFYPSNLAYGANLSTQAFGVTSGNRGDLAWGAGYTNSQFLNTGGYVGFQFDLGAGTQYGWAHLQLDQGVPANIFTLTQIAWADANESIFAGQVPAPGALAFLALGASGIVGWRRKRTA